MSVNSKSDKDVFYANYKKAVLQAMLYVLEICTFCFRATSWTFACLVLISTYKTDVFYWTVCTIFGVCSHSKHTAASTTHLAHVASAQKEWECNEERQCHAKAIRERQNHLYADTHHQRGH